MKLTDPNIEPFAALHPMFRVMSSAWPRRVEHNNHALCLREGHLIDTGPHFLKIYQSGSHL